MKKIVRVGTFEDAEKADLEFYRSLSGEEKLDILLQLINQGNVHEAPGRLKRVYRITKLASG